MRLTPEREKEIRAVKQPVMYEMADFGFIRNNWFLVQELLEEIDALRFVIILDSLRRYEGMSGMISDKPAK